ncbi:2-phospho-L-lactate guanylyltransferase [Bradyrhizobium sp.]|uniref:2-phospho-L-lactate guanylyltransferase n=1 Tax=Bradyrhizobium sp. TaxID=376 RepID=UPI003C778ACF
MSCAGNPAKVRAIVPVKRLDCAKQRLSPVLSRNERAELARIMLHDVLTCLCATPGLAGIIVVTSDPAVAGLARLFDARVVGDTMETGVNAAVRQGLKGLDLQSAALIVPSDVPFATAADLQAVLGELGQYPMVLAPALSDGGTNALALRRRGLIEPSFGDNSFARHRALARDGGVACGIVRVHGLGHDIDCPSDLLPWSGPRKASLTAALLAEFNVAERLGITALPVKEAYVK